MPFIQYLRPRNYLRNPVFFLAMGDQQLDTSGDGRTGIGDTKVRSSMGCVIAGNDDTTSGSMGRMSSTWNTSAQYIVYSVVIVQIKLQNAYIGEGSVKCISLSHFDLKVFGKGSQGSGQIEESDENHEDLISNASIVPKTPRTG